MTRKRSFKRCLRAVSPVIATIIIVAIAIVMSIAVAYWMLGIGATFTRFEKLEFISGYAVANNNSFDVKIKLKNTGTADATVDLVFLNGIPYTDYSPSVNITDGFINATLKPGDTLNATITLPKDGSSWRSGMSVEVMVQTVSGRQYPKTIVLP